jgi:hypothetical protein
MFGYVRPLRPELKVKDYESFRAMYCGLCHTLRSRYGMGTRMILSYDMCFLAHLMAGVTDCGIKTCGRRCAVSPLRRRACVSENSALDFAADCSVILTYWKLRDSAADSPGIKSIPHRMAALFMRRKYKKARRFLPDFAAGVESGIAELSKLERERVQSIDRPAHVFAEIMRRAAEGIADDRLRRPAEQVLYHVGRWVYIVDAWDDLDEDIKSGAYNAVAARFGLDTPEAREDARDAVTTTLMQSAATAAAAAELLDLGRSEAAVQNILYMGLPAMTDAVTSGQWKKRKQQRSQVHGSI